MNDLAQAQGFSPQMFLTNEATRAAVIESMNRAANELVSGDIFFLSYSGHGGQVPDINGDEKDYVDETWCLYDGELLDDEIYLRYCKFKEGVRVLVLSDSCHSGTVTRAPGGAAPTAPTTGPVAEELGTLNAAVRCMPMAAVVSTYMRNRAFYDGLQKDLPREKPPLRANVRLVSGCQDNQLSLDGVFNGLFTSRLLRVWNAGRFAGNYTEFHQKIVRGMPSQQSPHHFVIGPFDPVFADQKPFTV
jgi:hypothetical protein